MGFSAGGVEQMHFDANGITLRLQNEMRFSDNDNSHYVAIKPGTVSANRTLTLPNATGTIALVESSSITIGSSSVALGGTVTDIAGLGTLTPASNNTKDLGSNSLRWRNIYTADLQMSNEGSQNDVDGTWGSYTIQEGEDSLFLINKRNGKKFKFLLEEVN